MTYDNIQISRIIGNFKIDENDKIWFLFCSSLRIKERDDSMLRKYIYSEKLSETIYETRVKNEVKLNSSFLNEFFEIDSQNY